MCLYVCLFVCLFFSIWVFFHEHSRFTWWQGWGMVSVLTLPSSLPLPPASQTLLDFSWAVTAESSPLHIAISQTWTRNLWFPSASCKPLSYALTTHLLFLQNWDVFIQLKFIETIYEVNSVRSFQPSTITAYNGSSSSLLYRKHLESRCSFQYVAIHC